MSKNKHYKKKMTPRGAEFVDSAPSCLTKSIIINSPIENVWKVIDDTPNYSKWFPGVKWGKFENPENKGLGAKRLAQLNSSKYYEEIISYEPMKKWGFTMLESNSGACESISELISLESVGENQTKVTYQGGYEFKGFYKLIKGMSEKTINGIWDKALSGLKEYAEKK
jgi:carbon monoxide dehydrogenase subunit G